MTPDSGPFLRLKWEGQQKFARPYKAETFNPKTVFWTSWGSFEQAVWALRCQPRVLLDGADQLHLRASPKP